MALGASEVNHLFGSLRDECVRVFHVKASIEFGTTGKG